METYEVRVLVWAPNSKFGLIPIPGERIPIMFNYSSLFNPSVVAELQADSELALVFFSGFEPYDWEIDPLHNADWCAYTAPRKEQAALDKAKKSLALAKSWKV